MNSILDSLFVRRMWLVLPAFALLLAKSLPAATPLHHYDFNGNTVRDLVASLDGVLQNGANAQGGILTMGWAGGSVQFSGNLLPPRPPFSVAFFAQERERLAQSVENSTLKIGDIILGTGPFAIDGAWHHYAVTASTSEIRVYIDGHFARSILAAFPLEGRSTSRLGPEFAPNDTYFKGLIDEFWVFDGLLSESEVVNLSTQVHSANPQTVTWTDPPNDFLALNTAHPLGAAVASSGLPVTLRVDHGPAVIANGNITVTGPGTVWVTAEQAGNAFYASASKSRVFNMRQAAVSMVGQYSDTAAILDFAMNGNVLYAASGERGLQIFDVTNPALPKLVGRYPAPGDARKFNAVKISVAGNTAYVANKPPFDPNAGEGIFTNSCIDIIDITDLSNPKLLGSVSPLDFFISTGVFFANVSAMDVRGNFAYVAFSEGGPLIIDVSNPARPTIVGDFFNVDGFFVGPVWALQVSGSLIYLAGSGGLTICDISSPAAPRPIAQYFDLWSSTAIKVTDSAVCLLVQGKLTILKGDPANLVVIGRSAYLGYGGANGIDVRGDYVFLSKRTINEGDEFAPGGIEVYDASNPVRPIRIGGYRNSDSAFKVQIVGETAYVGGAGGAPLKALKVTLNEPPEPRLQISAVTRSPAGVIGGILSVSSIPGWELQGTATGSLAPDRVIWVNWGSLYGAGAFEERDGIQRYRLGHQLGAQFFRLHKLEF